MDRGGQSACIGCGAVLQIITGPTHPYMEASPACYEAFNRVLAFEYSDPTLQGTHRLTVDTYAVQHPGRAGTRQQIQSVGLHLARLGVQLDNSLSPRETNDVMLGLGKHKATLKRLEPPAAFTVKVADIAEFAGSASHSDNVRDWARATWADWSDHHDYIRAWTARWLSRRFT